MVMIDDYTLKGPEVEEADRIIAQAEQEMHEQQAYELDFQVPSVGSAEGARKFYGEPMDAEEYKVWKAFLPNRYSRQAGAWRYCHPKLVPQGVMEKIHTARSRRVFDDLQIWSAAPEDIDPMVVGVVKLREGWQYFKIARWGESLASLGAIAQTVKDRRHFVNTFLWRRVVLWSLAMAIATTVVAIVESATMAHVVVALGIILIVMGNLFIITSIDMTRQLERRAIRRYRPELPAEVSPAA